MTPLRRHKYGAQRVTQWGISFASKREHRRYAELRMLEQAGQIIALAPHPRFDLLTIGPADGPMRVASYTADATYVVLDPASGLGSWGEVIVEDVKSLPTMTTAARLRIRWYEAQTGERVRIVY